MKTQIVIVDLYEATADNKGYLLESAVAIDKDVAISYGENYVEEYGGWFEVKVETLQ